MIFTKAALTSKILFQGCNYYYYIVQMCIDIIIILETGFFFVLCAKTIKSSLRAFMIAANVRCMNLQLSVESILREFELNSEKLN